MTGYGRVTNIHVPKRERGSKKGKGRKKLKTRTFAFSGTPCERRRKKAKREKEAIRKNAWNIKERSRKRGLTCFMRESKWHWKMRKDGLGYVGGARRYSKTDPLRGFAKALSYGAWEKRNQGRDS